MKTMCINKLFWVWLTRELLQKPVRTPFLVLILAAGFGLPAQAHEIPDDVQVRVVVLPEAQVVQVALRVPLSAMRDFEFASRGPGYLDMGALDGQLRDAAELWLLEDLKLFADGAELGPAVLEAVRVALPSDGAFADPASAWQKIRTERLAETTSLYWEQALLDVALSYPNPAGAGADFDLEPSFARLGLTTLTRVAHRSPDGEIRTLTLPGNPGRVSLDPGVFEVFGRFLLMGFEHVLDGTDHLLFVLALVIPLLVIRPLIVVITAFTLAHSLTLGAAVLGLVPAGLWFPPLVELLIAVSILYMALENLLAPSARRRWLVAFGFGLVHGFGFSYALSSTLELAGDHLLVSLAGFNLGIEAGQLLVLAVAVPALRSLALRRIDSRLPVRAVNLVLSVLIAHTAWHWLVERWQVFSVYPLSLPPLDAAFAAGLMRWIMLVLIAALLIWLVRVPFERWARQAESVD